MVYRGRVYQGRCTRALHYPALHCPGCTTLPAVYMTSVTRWTQWCHRAGREPCQRLPCPSLGKEGRAGNPAQSCLSSAVNRAREDSDVWVQNG